MKSITDSDSLGEALRRAYPVPACSLEQASRMLEHMPQRLRPSACRRALVPAVALCLLIGIASALALSDWNVLRFLFGNTCQKSQQSLVQHVGLAQNVEGVQLTIDSAYYDGEFFAMDWTLQNTVPACPAYIQIEAFTVGGVRLNDDGNDSFQCQWLPGVYAPEGVMQNGEHIPLPVDRLQGDLAPVRLDIGVYWLRQSLYRLPEQGADLDQQQQHAERERNAALALQKMAEGYQVLWEDMLAVRDAHAPHGVAFVTGDIEAILPRTSYAKATLNAAFDLDIRSARRSEHLSQNKVQTGVPDENH